MERFRERGTLQLLLLEIEIIPFTMNATKPIPVKQSVPIDLLNEIDIRVGTIDLVEEVKGSDKMVKLTVNFGDHKRSILAGMRKERPNPKEVEGKQALFIVNIEPKRMFGELSEGMLFDIGYADGITPVLAVPERPVPNGTRAG
jgi:tRNA-binding protein